MKRTIMLSLITTSLMATTSVKDFSELIGGRNPKNVFGELLEKNPIVVVKCFSSFCPKCKKVAPDFARLSKKYQDKTLFVDMNVQKFDDITDAFKLQSVPTFLIFIYGKLHKKIRGSGNLDQVDQYLSSAAKTLN
jgi:thiol-disulfide isomerase/thioredoxin